MKNGEERNYLLMKKVMRFGSEWGAEMENSPYTLSQ